VVKKKKSEEPSKELPAGKPGSFLDLLFGIFTRPRQTIRSILRYKPGYGARNIILGTGLLMGLALQTQASALKIIPGPSGFLVCLIGSTLSMAVFFYFWCGMVYGVGLLFGGKGSFNDVFTALAWANAPIFIFGIFNILVDLPAWPRFVADLVVGGNGYYFPFYFPYSWIVYPVIRYGLGIWSLVASIIGLSEAHQFSIRRAVAVNILLLVAFGLAFGILVWVGVFAMLHLHPA
jgi:hypothetical protein